MSHCTEDDLILHYYGEAPGARAIDQHLAECAECADTYHTLERTLQLVSATEIPARDDSYPREVWHRLRGQLPERDAPWWQGLFAWQPAAMAAAVVTLVAVGFLAGRMWPQDFDRPLAETMSVDPAGSGERVRLAAIGDHLEQSERVLLDLVNAQGDRIDVSDQQMWAADLIDSNRFYRDAATSAGDLLVATVLDDLERSLLDVVHGPSTMTAAQLDDVRGRVDAAALLFKVRVLADELHERETPNLPIRKTT